MRTWFSRGTWVLLPKACFTLDAIHHACVQHRSMGAAWPFGTQRLLVRDATCDQGLFTLGDARSLFAQTSKIQPLGSMLNFDADVKNTTPRHQ